MFSVAPNAKRPEYLKPEKGVPDDSHSWDITLCKAPGTKGQDGFPNSGECDRCEAQLSGQDTYPKYPYHANHDKNARFYNVVFTMGSAYKDKRGNPTPPSIGDVVGDALRNAQDFRGPGIVTFEEWASEFGYDIDSRKAERIFALAQNNAKQFQKLLGVARLDALLDTWEDD